MRVKKITSMVLTSLMTLTLLSGIKPMEAKAAPENTTETKVQERKFIGYFPEWAYAQEAHEYYTVDMMPWDKVTHINYAFAVVNPTTNKIDFGDKKAAIEMEFKGQTADFPYKGHFNVLNSYKKKYPNVKTLISVGGWAGSTGFYTMCETAAGREAFANSCVEFIRTYGFNGVDIDYEYPTATKEAGNPLDFKVAETRRATLYANYCEMMKVLREKIDKASKADNKEYLVTAAVPASSWILGGMGLAEYAEYLDYINLMTYDFHGAWNGHVGPQSALYPDSRDTETQGFAMPVLNIDWAYRYFSGIMPPEKINIGAPYYTRGWKNVQKGSLPGGLYGSAWLSKVPGEEKGDGAVGIDNIWFDPDENGNEEPGGSNPLWHVKNLLKDPAYQYFWDDVTKTPYVWNESKKVFLTYEDEKSIQAKLDYIVEKDLGGIMIWELDGDYGLKADGSYGVGNTISGFIGDYLKKAKPLEVGGNKEKIPPSKNYEVQFSGKYDHPNYDFSMKIVNNTGADIPAGWKLQFDLPKSCYVEKVYTGTIDSGVDNGEMRRYTITGPSWSNLKNGASAEITGVIKLCFSGGPQNFTLNGFSSEAEVGKVDPDESILPLKGTLKSNKTESTDGNYDVSLDIPANSRATSFKIYEGDKVVKSGAITGTAAQTVTYNVKNKVKGSYDYKAELINEYGSVQTSKVTVVVNREDGGGQATDLAVDFKVTSDWGTGGQYSITLTNIGTQTIKSWDVELDFPVKITGSWNSTFKDLGNGRYKFTSDQFFKGIEAGKSYSFSGPTMGGAAGQEAYNIVTNVVYEDGSIGGGGTEPVEPKLQAAKVGVDKATNTGDYTVTVTVPKTNSATSVKIYENTTLIKEETLTANASADKVISIPVTKKAVGNYEYKAVVSDGKTTLDSSIIKVTVQENGGGTGDVSAWVAMTNYKAGDLVSYSGSTYECRQPHLSLPGWEPANIPALWLKK